MQKNHFLIEKIKKYRKCPALTLSSSSVRGGGGGSSFSLHKLMKNFWPEVFLVLTQMPARGVTNTLGYSGSGTEIVRESWEQVSITEVVNVRVLVTKFIGDSKIH